MGDVKNWHRIGWAIQHKNGRLMRSWNRRNPFVYETQKEAMEQKTYIADRIIKVYLTYSLIK